MATVTARGPRTTQRWPLRDLVRYVGPNWYAAVMGTAIVANAGAGLPLIDSHLLQAIFRVVWAASFLALLGVVAARVLQYYWHRDQVRATIRDPAMAPFFGCAAMAMLAVGAGTMLVGADVLGSRAALAVDTVLWIAGTVLGLIVAVTVPFLIITQFELPHGSAAPTWLLAVVPPMVSAATGSLLVPHVPAGEPRETMLVGCYALFGASLLATFTILPVVFSRLAHYKLGPLVATPALWLVLGPLGQSVTATNQLADVAMDGVNREYHRPLELFGVIYGVPVLGFAMLWMAIAAAATIRAFRQRMPFALTWWAFTFPVGTCVTGATGLYKHTGLHVYAWLALALFGLLVVAWVTTALRTLYGSTLGTLLVPRAHG